MKTLLMILMIGTVSPAQAEKFCPEHDFTTLHSFDGGYLLWEGQTEHWCYPKDAQWHMCDADPDYLVRFERHSDEIWIQQPAYADDEYTKFSLCQ